VAKPQKNSPLHLFKATQSVYLKMIERGEICTTSELQDLNRVLDTMETNGHLAPSDPNKYHSAYRRFAEYTRTFVQAHILQRLPKPPHWAPDYPEPKRLEKHMPKLMEYAILLMDSTPPQEQDLSVPNLTGERGPSAPAYCQVH
jgi:hypothetical protein